MTLFNRRRKATSDSPEVPDNSPKNKRAEAQFSCRKDPEDSASVRSLRDENGTPGVVVMVTNVFPNESVRASVILSPRDARRYAAAVLNAADDADGTEPMPSLSVEV